MALGTSQLTANPSLGDRVSMERLPHRLDRLAPWMEQNSLDATRARSAPSTSPTWAATRATTAARRAIVVGRDRSRTLVVMHDEVPVAQELGDADDVLPYGERGFGLNLNPLPLLAAVVAGVRRGQVGAAGSASATRSAAWPTCCGSNNDAEQVDAGRTLYRIRLLKDEDELVKVLHSYELCLAGAARPSARWRSSRESPRSSCSRPRWPPPRTPTAAPIEFLTDMLSGPLTSKVCCPIHVASPREVQDGDAVVADIALGAHGYFGDTAETHIVGLEPGGVGDARAAARDPGAGRHRAGARQHRRGGLRRHEPAHPGVVPGRRVPPPRRPRHLGLGVRGPAPDPDRPHAARELDAAGGRAGRLLPRPESVRGSRTSSWSPPTAASSCATRWGPDDRARLRSSHRIHRLRPRPGRSRSTATSSAWR